MRQSADPDEEQRRVIVAIDGSFGVLDDLDVLSRGPDDRAAYLDSVWSEHLRS